MAISITWMCCIRNPLNTIRITYLQLIFVSQSYFVECLPISKIPYQIDLIIGIYLWFLYCYYFLQYVVKSKYQTVFFTILIVLTWLCFKTFKSFGCHLEKCIQGRITNWLSSRFASSTLIIGQVVISIYINIILIVVII